MHSVLHYKMLVLARDVLLSNRAVAEKQSGEQCDVSVVQGLTVTYPEFQGYVYQPDARITSWSN